MWLVILQHIKKFKYDKGDESSNKKKKETKRRNQVTSYPVTEEKENVYHVPFTETKNTAAMNHHLQNHSLDNENAERDAVFHMTMSAYNIGDANDALDDCFTQTQEF